MAGQPMGQREQTLAAIGFVALAAAGAYWYFMYKPKAEVLAAQEVRLASLDSLNTKAKRESSPAQVRTIQAEVDDYRANLDLIRRLVPTSNEVPALLDQISSSARRVGLEIAAVDPQPVVEGEQFSTYRYNIGVVGPYHALGQFLASIGSLQRIVAPVNVRLIPPTNPNSQAVKRGKGAVEARFQIQTFVAHGGGDAAPGRPGAGGGQ